jgi:glycerol uptake facilitator protein
MAKRRKASGPVGELLAEFAGTLILILFGCGVVAQVVAAGVGEVPSIHWAWGLGTTMGVYVAGRTSGAHLNPAVTVALAVFRRFPWRKVAPYSLAQLLGAFVAALIVRWNYSEALAAFDPGHTARSQGVFSTRPASELGVGDWAAFRDLTIGTALLLFLLLALSDALTTPAQAALTPLAVGLLVVAIGMAWGGNAGYAINPARDLGPRLASFLTGYDGAFRNTTGHPYWWIPVVAPFAGALLGAALYQTLIARWRPPDAEAAPEPDVDAGPEPDRRPIPQDNARATA